jgi:hypothetical protein
MNDTINLLRTKMTHKKRDKKAIDKQAEDIYLKNCELLARQTLQNRKEVIELDISSESEIAEVDSLRTKEIKQRLENYSILCESSAEAEMNSIDKAKQNNKCPKYDKIPDEDESLVMLTKSNVTKKISRHSA